MNRGTAASGRWAAGAYALALWCLGVVGCGDLTDDATRTGEACAESDLLAQCPVGTNRVLGAEATQACSGQVDVSSGVVEQDGSAVGQCSGTGSCQVFCEFVSPCTCGVASLSLDAVICAECPNQSCGDGRCEGTERPECAPGEQGCFPCAEDCGGSTCGDGDCTATESPETCPQDCARQCDPNSVFCVANSLRICSADGSSYTETDCSLAGLICLDGTCVPGGTCGNGVCEAGESPASCPQDCATSCTPGVAACEGDTLVVCQDDGEFRPEVACADTGLICANGACVSPNVCGNGRCEEGETPETCADCVVICGNGVCETGEPVTCPQDCTRCGNAVCEAGEQDSCPQDCGECIPNARSCLGTTLVVCAANGASSREVDCAASEQICSRGECVPGEVCGNGACEAGEPTTCPADCTELCGNGVCGPGESFSSCSNDCRPVCGDGACDAPSESTATCASDCLSTCGNGACDATETRDSCSIDCGFCGDGVCQDGYESPSDRPVGELEPCRADCVVFGCTTAADCDDRIACTTNACVAGTCVYTADNTACGTGERCLERAGCCADADGDTFTAEACGGSDCDDTDFAVRPGGNEICGGGDRNCNGIHRPALVRDVTQVTSSLSSKTMLQVAWDGRRYVMVWLSAPTGVAEVQYVFADASGRLQGTPATLDASGVVWDNTFPHHQMRVLYSPATDRTAVLFGGLFRWIASDGTLEPAEPLRTECGYVAEQKRPSLQFLGDRYLCASSRMAANNDGGSLVSEAGGVTGFDTRYALNAFAWLVDAQADGTYRVHVVGPQYLWVFDESAASLNSGTLHGGTHLTGTPWAVLDNDAGERTIITISVGDATGVWLERLALGGGRIAERQLTSLNLTVADIEHDAAARQIALLLTDGANLYFGIVNADGTDALPIGLVASGAGLRDAQIVRNGTGYSVWYTAQTGGLQQVFTAPIVCE